MTQLDDFLSAAKNTTSREVMLAHRTIFDLKLAAASSGYDLRVFRPDVDRDGYDLVLEDGDTLVRVQLKATLDAAAPATNVHKSLLRPDEYTCERFGFESSPTGIGLGGGVLQCIADSRQPDLRLAYRYADIRTLVAFHWQLLSGPGGGARARIIRVLRAGSGKEPVTLSPAMMLVPRSVDALLSLMGLRSSVDSGWPQSMDTLGIKTQGHGPRARDGFDVERQFATDSLLALVKTNANSRDDG